MGREDEISTPMQAPCVSVTVFGPHAIRTTHLYSPMNTGIVASDGRQPASGLTPAVWYSRAVSTCMRRPIGQISSQKKKESKKNRTKDKKKFCSRPLYH